MERTLSTVLQIVSDMSYLGSGEPLFPSTSESDAPRNELERRHRPRQILHFFVNRFLLDLFLVSSFDCHGVQLYRINLSR